MKRLRDAVIHGPIGRKILLSRTRSNVLPQLHTGVTTIRSLGEFGDEVLKVRDKINEGKAVGPTLLASGPLLAATGGHGAPPTSPLLQMIHGVPEEMRDRTSRWASM